MVAFLEKLADLMGGTTKNALPLRVAAEMAEVYGLFQSKNPEISVPFLKLAIAAGDLSAMPPTEALVRAQGRMKYIRPLYRAMFNQPSTKNDALRIFQEVRHTYHPIAEKMVAQDLGLN
uniref:Peptidase M1 leukotriene A4 hydrolase/aminopeptidase C-terminal domain-containing protein n=1 Tax=Polytomella parva TaxID=51329 RepID=A0A7S0VL87_9CHLO|mmetsp:Transcript_8524/g.16319  ORF Transcript_8524/g.16319 Transcript_8524/m.16319 type:complete len:119 (+) Transcript_8524:110-466(+)